MSATGKVSAFDQAKYTRSRSLSEGDKFVGLVKSLQNPPQSPSTKEALVVDGFRMKYFRALSSTIEHEITKNKKEAVPRKAPNHLKDDPELYVGSHAGYIKQQTCLDLLATSRKNPTASVNPDDDEEVIVASSSSTSRSSTKPIPIPSPTNDTFTYFKSRFINDTTSGDDSSTNPSPVGSPENSFLFTEVVV